MAKKKMMHIWLYHAFLLVLQLIMRLTMKKTCRHLLLTALFSIGTVAYGQDAMSVKPTKAWSHLDLSLTTGSTGLGLDVSMPISNVFSVRGGYAFMPHFTHTMHFGVEVGDDPDLSQQRFDKLAGLLEGLTSNKVDNVVDVVGKPTYWNWKLMVDMKPFRNKHWHLTAGVYYGSREVAQAVNAIEEMPSLMAVSIYNTMYYRVQNGDPMMVVGEMAFDIPEIRDKINEWGKMSILIGEYSHDVPYKEDVVNSKGEFIDDEYYPAGTYVYHRANDPDDPQYRTGDPYRVVPDENSMVKAWAYANRLKPYLGFGYGGRLLKNDDSWQVSFDCGAMFWGGVPEIIMHDGTDLVNDVQNVRGKVGDYVDIIKKIKFFPVLNLRITKRLF